MQNNRENTKGNGVRSYIVDNKVFYSQLKKFAVPIALQTFMTAAISAGDSAMLGFVNQDSLAAVSKSFSPFSIEAKIALHLSSSSTRMCFALTVAPLEKCCGFSS